MLKCIFLIYRNRVRSHAHTQTSAPVYIYTNIHNSVVKVDYSCSGIISVKHTCGLQGLLLIYSHDIPCCRWSYWRQRRSDASRTFFRILPVASLQWPELRVSAFVAIYRAALFSHMSGKILAWVIYLFNTSLHRKLLSRCTSCSNIAQMRKQQPGGCYSPSCKQ